MANVDRHRRGSTGKPKRITQLSLFKSGELLEIASDSPMGCKVVSVGKRRDGGTRYWCLRHHADATAKYGKPAQQCRASHIPPIGTNDIFELDVDKYRGGIALWGAVPAVYDTTTLPMDRGIHVHARRTPNSSKEMDRTFRAVKIVSQRLPDNGIVVTETDAIYFMVTSVFGFEMKYVTCSFCGWPHLDRDWFSVRPHRRHLCAGCGKHFRDTAIGIGNPIIGIRDLYGLGQHKIAQSRRKLNIKQKDFPGGIQIWGSNSAFLWTSDKPEEAGIHVHAFGERLDAPELDETYGHVMIDGVDLDPVMVRVLMAQLTLPSLKNRILSMECPACKSPQFASDEEAYTPSIEHSCTQCAKKFKTVGRIRKAIANPLLEILARLTKTAPRMAQQQDLELLPETL